MSLKPCPHTGSLGRYDYELTESDRRHEAREEFVENKWRNEDLLAILFDDISEKVIDDLNDILRNDSAAFGNHVEKIVREKLWRMAKQAKP